MLIFSFFENEVKIIIIIFKKVESYLDLLLK